MRLFLTLLILIFSFQSWTKADDLSDFEIEGMSIGDSLLNNFSEKEIKEAISYSASSYKSNKFKRATFVTQNFKIYDAMFFHLKQDDNNYKIFAIGSALNFPNDIKNCNIKRTEIVNDLKSLFIDYEINDYKRKHDQDETGESIFFSTDFSFLNGQSARVMCYDWSKNFEDKNFVDHLRISLYSKKFREWLYTEAW